MTQKEFEQIIKMYGEIKDFAKTKKRLVEVMAKLDEIKSLISRRNAFNNFSTMMELFQQQNWMLKDYFTIGEAADFIGVSYQSFRTLIEDRGIPYYVIELEDKTLVKKEELVEWIHKNRMMSQKEIEENARKILEQVKKRQARNRANMAKRKAKKINEERRNIIKDNSNDKNHINPRPTDQGS